MEAARAVEVPAKPPEDGLVPSPSSHEVPIGGSSFAKATWEGDFDNFKQPLCFCCGAKTVEPYMNFHVFVLMDIMRGCILLANVIATVFVHHFVTIDAPMGMDGLWSIQRPKTSSGVLLLVVVAALEFLQYLEIAFLLLFVKFLFSPKRDIKYRFCDWLLHKWHKGKPPWLPIDAQSQALQSIFFGMCFIMMAVGFRVYRYDDQSASDRVVSKLIPSTAICYLTLVHSARKS